MVGALLRALSMVHTVQNTESKFLCITTLVTTFKMLLTNKCVIFFSNAPMEILNFFMKGNLTSINLSHNRVGWILYLLNSVIFN